MTCDTRPTLGVLLCMLAAAAGCAHGGGPRTAEVARSIEVALPQCELQRESHFSLSGLKLSAVKVLVDLADDTEGAEILADLKRVEVATYQVPAAERCRDLQGLGMIEAELIEHGWALAVREQGVGSAAWVFMRGERDGQTEGLYVVTFDQRELEIVRLEGRIDEFLTEAIAETPSKASEMVSADF